MLAHSAKACTELLPNAKGLTACTIQEFPCSALLRTIPGPFVILYPPPVTDSSGLQVATLCVSPANNTIDPGTFLIVRFISFILYAGPGGPMGPGGPCLTF